MIRLYTDGPLPAPDTEAAVRIGSLAEAYGKDCPFTRIWRTDSGSFLSLLDGNAILNLCAQENRLSEQSIEEVFWFLSMQPEIHSVRTDAETARRLAKFPAFSAAPRLETGEVLCLEGALSAGPVSAVPATAREIYPLLSLCFDAALPPFESWYVDVSHRLRHGVCHTAAIFREGAVVASAMSVAEYAGTALLGAVATHPDYRGRGYATACLRALAEQLPGRRILLSPKNAYAAGLYAHLGFVPFGRWGVVYRENG